MAEYALDRACTCREERAEGCNPRPAFVDNQTEGHRGCISRKAVTLDLYPLGAFEATTATTSCGGNEQKGNDCGVNHDDLVRQRTGLRRQVEHPRRRLDDDGPRAEPYGDRCPYRVSTRRRARTASLPTSPPEYRRRDGRRSEWQRHPGRGTVRLRAAAGYASRITDCPAACSEPPASSTGSSNTIRLGARRRR